MLKALRTNDTLRHFRGNYPRVKHQGLSQKTARSIANYILHGVSTDEAKHIVYDIFCKTPAWHIGKVAHQYKQLVLRMKLKLRKRVQCIRVPRSK